MKLKKKKKSVTMTEMSMANWQSFRSKLTSTSSETKTGPKPLENLNMG